MALERVQDAQKKQKLYYDKNTKKTQCFLVGDVVFLHNPSVPLGKMPKFHHFWRGPFRIEEISSDGTNAMLRSVYFPREAQIRTHCNRLKLARMRDEGNEQQQGEQQSEPVDEAAQPQVQDEDVIEDAMDAQDDQEMQHQHGLLVWAKVTGHPYLPATTIGLRQLPVNLLSQRHAETDVPVRFLHYETVAWVPKSRVYDYAEHRDNFAKNSKTKAFRTAVDIADEIHRRRPT
jgi:hypothetical protein